ncbi:BnaC05g26070D [Brassica napus]|uniref:BnaC05g26070D protein n=2 Tax=Brassica napus TaxID=3708 RepID=A0A078G2Z3_BRANA|nr:BnaC05g26070D [Brassica napus]
MAYSSSLFPSPFFSTDSSLFEVEVTRDEFHSFHKIDRDLFTRLVFVLKRDMNQSSQVIAFLLVVEELGFARNLVAYLVSSPDILIDAVASEVGVCISILYNQDYSSFFLLNHNNNDEVVIPFLKGLTDSNLTLSYINQYRETILVGVTKNLNDVCNRAFDDIYEKGYKEQLLALERATVIEEMKKIRLGAPQQTLTRLSVQHQTPSWWNVQQQIPPVDEKAKAAVKETKRVDNKDDEEEVTPADDRTVFLTFSKGYPISESEVRVHFTRKFGEVIEAIVMQEVQENEQPLFARMVLKMEYASKIEEIVTPMNKNKFTIDGKHVLVRKFFAAPSSSHV